MKKSIVVILLLALVVALAGCAQQEKTEGKYLGEKTGADEPTQTGEAKSPQTPTGETKLFNIVAKQFLFEPATITVNKGDTVELHITTDDVKHGFMLTAYNINETIEPGKLTDIEFVADKAGEFPFYCSVPCGPGHPEMQGLLVVKG